MNRTFGNAVSRSIVAAPPGMTQADWSKTTPEGRLVAAAQAVEDSGLVAWLMAAPMKEASE